MDRSKGKKNNNLSFSMAMRKQLAVFFIFILLAFVALLARMAIINATKGEEYKRQVLSQGKYDSVTLPYQRGSIVDCKGTTMAVSKKVYNVIMDASVLTYFENRKEGYIAATTDALAKSFGADRSALISYIKENPTGKYYIVAKRLEYEDIQGFNDLVAASKEDKEATEIKGVWFEEEYLRYYPGGSLACDVIGYTNSGNAGAYGLEEYYNDTLNGTDGREYGYLNDELNLERTTIEAVDGCTLVTSIDANIQRIVENKIADYNETYKDYYREGDGAQNVGVIVMGVDTGEILAMASYPNFDLNSPREISYYYTQEEIDAAAQEGITEQELLAKLWKNYCISETYEPGSVFKPFTVAIGLDSGKMTGNEEYFCGGSLEVGGYKIKCHNRNGDGMMTVESAIAQSCNVALMQMGQQIGTDTFMDYFEDFNFGLKTNIDLTGEARTASLVFNKSTMGSTELATSTFGQGNNMTMIEMATAFASLVNGGYYYEPHVVKQVLNSEGAVIENKQPRLLKQTISNTTSDRMLEYLKSVVTTGTGKAARPAGYMIGGKTGTAETAPRGTGDYVVSFMGVAPADDPEVLVYVVIDRPNMPDQTNGTNRACNICREIMTEMLPYMNIFMTEELSEKEIEELTQKGLYNANIVIPEEEEEEVPSETQEEEKPSKPEMKIDPNTGYAIAPDNGEFLDPETGYPIDPKSSFMENLNPSEENEDKKEE